NPADTGALLLGTDGANYRAFKTDADGHLQVDVVTTSGSVQYTEGDTDATITGNAILWEDTGNALTTVNASKPLPVDIKNASVAITNAALTELAAAINSDKVDVNITNASVPVSL